MKTGSTLPWCAALALAFATAPAPRASDTQPGIALDNVVIVLDASGSMDGAMPRSRIIKMDAAKEALRQVIGQLPPNVQIGLLVFSGKNVPDPWLYPLGPRDDPGLIKAINRPQPAGGTPLGANIKKAADRLLEERQRQFGYGTFRLLIVTDGEAQDKPLVERFTPEVIARGITVDVIGVAMDQKHTLATRAHSYRAANDPQALQQAVAEVFAEIGTTADDSASTEAFAALATIPDAVATAALQALATSGNHPIGESLPVPPKPATSASPAAPPAPVAPPDHHSPTPSSHGVPVIWGLLGALLCSGVVGLLLLVIIIRALTKRRRP